MSKVPSMQCTGKYTKQKPEPNEDEVRDKDEDTEESPPSRRLLYAPFKSYEHHDTSKYHVKCVDGEFKEQPAPSPSPPTPTEREPQKRSSLLDIVTRDDRCCVCPLVAHAVRSHIHMNVGLQEKREEMNKKPN